MSKWAISRLLQIADTISQDAKRIVQTNNMTQDTPPEDTKAETARERERVESLDGLSTTRAGARQKVKGSAVAILNTYSYIRVSTREQNEDRQLIALREMPVSEQNIFMDKQSGKAFNRPQYEKLIRKLKPDDLFYAKSIDRLGAIMRKLKISGDSHQREKGQHCGTGYAALRHPSG